MNLARIARITTGSTLLMAGTAMLVLPGPGLVTIAAGLHVLSKDVPLAGRLKDKAARRLKRR
jgi:hypothetical protein